MGIVLVFALVGLLNFAAGESIPTKHEVRKRQQNGFDGVLDVDCSDSQAFYRVQSEYDDGFGDRRWTWSCKGATEVPYDDSQTQEMGFVNGLGGVLSFQCPTDYVMTGVYSEHDNGAEDREWRFTCKYAPGYFTQQCILSDYINDYNADMDYTDSGSRVFVGAFSVYNGAAKDRRWKITSCEYNPGTVEVSTEHKTYVVDEGGTTAVITCTTVGNIAPSDISFYSPSGLLLDGTSSDVTLTSLAEVSSPSGDIEYSRSMTLANTEYGDSGGYTCQATSPGNTVTIVTFNIHVEAIFSLASTPELLFQQPLVITCLASMYTPEDAIITWQRMGPDGVTSEVIPEAGTTVVREEFGHLLQTVLTIDEVYFYHVGVYTCNVDNLKTSVNVQLVRETPDTSIKIAVTSFGSRWVELELTDVYNENKPIDSFMIYQNDSMIQNHFNFTQRQANELCHGKLFSVMYNISLDIYPFTNYVFNVRPCNDLGCTETDESVSVKTLQSSATPPRYLEVVVNSTETTSLELKWLEPEYPNGIIVFYRVDYVGTKLYYVTEELLTDLNLEGSIDTLGPTLNFTLTGLVPGTQYNVTVTAFNGQYKQTCNGGYISELIMGYPSSVVTESTLVDAPPSGEEGFLPPSSLDPPVLINDGQEVALALPRPLNINGPLSHNQVIVVLLPEHACPAILQSPDMLFPNVESFVAYDYVLTEYNGSYTVAYISAEFDDKDFPAYNVFIVGPQEELVGDQPNDRQYNYSNGPLPPHGFFFAFFLRTYPLTDFGEVHQTERQYSLFSSSSYLYTEGCGESPVDAPVIIGVSAGAAGLFVLIVLVVNVVAVIVSSAGRKNIRRKDTEVIMEEQPFTKDEDIEMQNAVFDDSA